MVILCTLSPLVLLLDLTVESRPLGPAQLFITKALPELLLPPRGMGLLENSPDPNCNSRGRNAVARNVNLVDPEVGLPTYQLGF